MNLNALSKKMKLATGARRLPARVARGLLELVFAEIGAELQEKGEAHLTGFGVFSVRARKARRIRNPQTNEWMQLPETRTVGFRPSKHLVAKLRGGER